MYPFVFYNPHPSKKKSDPDPFNDRDPLVVIAAPWMQLIHVPRVNSLEFTTYGTITLTFKTNKLLKGVFKLHFLPLKQIIYYKKSAFILGFPP